MSVTKYVKSVESSLEKAGFPSTGWRYTSKGHLAFTLDDGSTHFISKTPGDHRVVKNFVSQVRRKVALAAEGRPGCVSAGLPQGETLH